MLLEETYPFNVLLECKIAEKAALSFLSDYFPDSSIKKKYIL
jgi:hypothetical protein